MMKKRLINCRCKQSYRPKFVLEGVAPATVALQEKMDEMFGDLGEWCIPIFDNVIIGAHSYDECVEKSKLFLERCRHHNFYVKWQNVCLRWKIRIFLVIISVGNRSK